MSQSSILTPAAAPVLASIVPTEPEAALASAAAAEAARAEQFRRNVGTVSIVCLLVLATFYTLYFARDVFLPIAMAGVLKLMLNPGVRGLSNLGIPYPVGAAITLIVFLVGCCSVCYVLAAPASEWAMRMPQWLPVLQAKIKFMAVPVERALQAVGQLDRIIADGTNGGTPAAAPSGSPSIVQFLFTGTRSVVSLLATMILLLYFLLAAGDTFLRRLVEVLPRLRDKKHAVEMTRQVERDISSYLVSITVIYAAVGTLTGLGLAVLGMPDPLLWGVLVFLLGYIPYLGPLIGIVVLGFAGLMSFDTVGHALLIPGFYGALVAIEGQFVTPIVLARRLTLNPVALFVSLLLWGFIWGVPGALLAVPLLATFKIACDHIKPLAPVGHFLGE